MGAAVALVAVPAEVNIIRGEIEPLAGAHALGDFVVPLYIPPTSASLTLFHFTLTCLRQVGQYQVTTWVSLLMVLIIGLPQHVGLAIGIHRDCNQEILVPTELIVSLYKTSCQQPLHQLVIHNRRPIWLGIDFITALIMNPGGFND